MPDPDDATAPDRPGPPAPAVDIAAAQLDIAGLLGHVEELILGGPRRYTRAEVSAAAGVDSSDSQRLWRSLGFATVGSDEIVFTDGDVAALRQVQRLIDNGLADDELRTGMTRLLGQTFARVASWQGQLLIEMIGQRPDLLESERAIEELIDTLLPDIEKLQNFVWRRQLVAYFTRVVSGVDADLTERLASPMAVGFVDMSGFTTLTRRASEAQLRDLLEVFESLATDIVGSHGGRIVKTIGDEVLFAVDAPGDAALIAVELVEAGEADERLPSLRAGVATGPVVSRFGDVYGSTVNIASRLTSISRPGCVLVDRELAEALHGDPRFTLKARRPESVRGFHHLRPFRLRRAQAPKPRR